MRYKVFRSNNDKKVHVICMEDAFDALPDCIRHMGPWNTQGEHDFDKLKPAYRAQIAEQGFAFIYRSMVGFTHQI